MRKTDLPKPQVPRAPGERRQYKTPVLVHHGSVRQVTFGSAGPLGDAGGTRRAKKASDPLAKHDMARVGTHPLGIGLYLYRYRPEFVPLFGGARHFGAMADEVEKVLPQAVGRHPCGIRTVDYGMLGIEDLGQRGGS